MGDKYLAAHLHHVDSCASCLFQVFLVANDRLADSKRAAVLIPLSLKVAVRAPAQKKLVTAVGKLAANFAAAASQRGANRLQFFAVVDWLRFDSMPSNVDALVFVHKETG